MAEAGLLYIGHRSSLLRNISLQFFTEIIKQRSRRLYVLINCFSDGTSVDSDLVTNFISNWHTQCHSHCHDIDVRIMCDAFKQPLKPEAFIERRRKQIGFVVSDVPIDDKPSQRILESLNVPRYYVETEAYASMQSEIPSKFPHAKIDICSHSGVVLGGTFDRIHNGHKILLTTAALLAQDRLIVGITDGPLLERKHLVEIIQPVDVRMNTVAEFVKDIDLTIEVETVPITDPFGPSITDANLSCLVCSEETLRGGRAVNEKRREKGLKELFLHVVNLAQEPREYAGNDNAASDLHAKISSTQIRRALLGTLYRTPIAKSGLPQQPYIVGLTGGIASGKSHIAEYIGKLGAYIIDCDKLGHAAYAPGSEGFKKVVQAFGDAIVDAATGSINRKALGGLCFRDKASMSRLEAIVWPVIAKMVQDEIEKAKTNGFKIVVVEAAILIEAKWDLMVHEVWVTYVPVQEAIKRIMTRNNLSEEDARSRVEAQLSNAERLAKANVIFCSLWEYEVTERQVDKAWTAVGQRLNT